MSYLTLKWGTLKAWDFSDSEEGIRLLEEYANYGMCWGATQQQDTPEQRDIICKLIDICDTAIINDWDGKEMTKSEAKKYVREYGRA